jgi:hypothetical protein
MLHGIVPCIERAAAVFDAIFEVYCAGSGVLGASFT